jgi:hypothetical protein
LLTHSGTQKLARIRSETWLFFNRLTFEELGDDTD